MPRSAFGANRLMEDGIDRYCLECARLRKLENQRKNRNKIGGGVNSPSDFKYLDNKSGNTVNNKKLKDHEYLCPGYHIEAWRSGDFVIGVCSECKQRLESWRTQQVVMSYDEYQIYKSLKKDYQS